MAKWVSTKTYAHSEGLSCAFRQWRATSHCNLIHGYALQVELVFEADTLDARNWVQDFGGLKSIKQWLHDNFDHTLCVAEDDPMLAEFQRLTAMGLADVRVLPSVGCEKFSEVIFNYVNDYVMDESNGRVSVRSVEVREHGGNSARYER